MLPKFSLPPNGELPPTLIAGFWHGGFSARRRNPFACCYFKHYSSTVCDYDACAYLKQFGETRERQARVFARWQQNIPLEFWPILDRLPLTVEIEYLADAMPVYAIKNYLTIKGYIYYFKGEEVLELFSGICTLLMAFAYLPSHFLPRRWIAVDIDQRRLNVCRAVGNKLGVDVTVIKRDIGASKIDYPRTSVVSGSPPCHEFSTAKVSSLRNPEAGLFLVERYLQIVKTLKPRFAFFEEASSVKSTREDLERLLREYGWKFEWVVLREYGAIQFRRERLLGALLTEDSNI